MGKHSKVATVVDRSTGQERTLTPEQIADREEIYKAANITAADIPGNVDMGETR